MAQFLAQRAQGEVGELVADDGLGRVLHQGQDLLDLQILQDVDGEVFHVRGGVEFVLNLVFVDREVAGEDRC